MMPNFVDRAKSWWRRGRNWAERQWTTMRPGPGAVRGACWGGVLVPGVISVVVAARYLQSGFGRAFDFVFVTVFAALLVPLTAGVFALLLTVLRKLPRRKTGLAVGVGVLVAMIWAPPQLGATLAVLFVLANAALGAGLAAIFSGEFAESRWKQRALLLVLLGLGVSADAGFAWLLAHRGNLNKLVTWRPPASTLPPALTVPNPNAAGPYRVQTLVYGSGTDRRRPEYGAAVAIKTPTVGAADFFPEFGGWKRWVRKTYWGFDVDRLPLNGRVWYPAGDGPFPLVLLVHGNHNMADFSDTGYAYLGEHLASRGFILASVDENFLNYGLFHNLPKEQAVRGWLLLEHLRLWKTWNDTKGNPFHGRIDLSRLALMGHSRGGEAVATAALFNRLKYCPENANITFDYGFDLRALVAIAPVDGQYKPAEQHRWLENISYLTLHGSHDADVSSFHGSRQWDHLRYTQPGPWFKAEIYAYRANHGQFNTGWGDDDVGKPQGWFLNRRPLLSGEDQRRIAMTYITAFLEATLRDRRDYLPLFRDWRVGRQWLPETIYVNRYQDPTYVPLATYREDADLTTTTAAGGSIEGRGLSIWREARIPWRDGNREYNGVFLGWNRAGKEAQVASYAITLPEGAAAVWGLGRAWTLDLSVAALEEDAPLPGKKVGDKKVGEAKTGARKDRPSPNFTVELVTVDGTTASCEVSRFGAIPPPLKEQFTKISRLDTLRYKKDWEPVFQTVSLPLSAFAGVDLTGLKTVRLKFDRTPESVICVSRIGFSQP